LLWSRPEAVLYYTSEVTCHLTPGNCLKQQHRRTLFSVASLSALRTHSTVNFDHLSELTGIGGIGDFRIVYIGTEGV